MRYIFSAVLVTALVATTYYGLVTDKIVHAVVFGIISALAFYFINNQKAADRQVGLWP